MRRYVFRLAMLTLAVLGPGVVRGDDQQIAEQIQQKLKAEKQAGTLKGFSIDLQVDEGTVWLSGRVATADQHDKALDVARRIPGVRQVVDDLTISPPATKPASPASTLPPNVVRNPYVDAGTTSAPRIAVQPVLAAQDGANGSGTAIGTGVDSSASSVRRQTVVHAAQPVANLPPQPIPSPVAPQPIPVAIAPQAAAQMPYVVAVPVYAGSRTQVPVPFAPATYQSAVEGVPGAPMPMYMPGSGVGIAPARYDHPTMPGYAWPSYAAYPNYAGVTYPKQYSPTAWPYIGPFYPYPQVPLGWRKVSLEWDDGWWMLDFKDRRGTYRHF